MTATKSALHTSPPIGAVMIIALGAMAVGYLVHRSEPTPGQMVRTMAPPTMTRAKLLHFAEKLGPAVAAAVDELGNHTTDEDPLPTKSTARGTKHVDIATTNNTAEPMLGTIAFDVEAKAKLTTPSLVDARRREIHEFTITVQLNAQGWSVKDVQQRTISCHDDAEGFGPVQQAETETGESLSTSKIIRRAMQLVRQ